MSQPKVKSPAPQHSQSHEEIFVQWYGRLLSRALRLTNYHWANAEDLVHDVFIELALRHSDNPTIENLESYLFTMLRNAHTSQARRAGQDRTEQLCITDYDSLELGLHTAFGQMEQQAQHSQLRVREELQRACQYACIRKETSKAWGVLILRFFHGYYPSEIVKVTRASRPAVDEWLWTARREAKLHINEPQRLRVIAGGPLMLKGDGPRLSANLSTPEMMRELRAGVFRTRRGECFTQEQLRELYRAEAASLECATLAHVVSCAQCLDEVNSLLGLIPLSERYPVDVLGNDKGPDDDGPGSGGGADGGGMDEARRRVQRRVRAVIEHRPRLLRIAVNGRYVCGQTITSQRSEQTLNVDLIDLVEPLEFIEVFSEQDVRLLMMDVDEQLGEQTRCVELSEGRTLSVRLNRTGPRPELHVAYALQTENAATHELALAREGNDSDQSRPGLFAWLSDLCGDYFRTRIWLRPGTATAILSLLLIAALLFVRLQHSPIPTVTAAELLRQSAIADETIAARTDQVLHRTINLEERSTGGELIARRRIEVWQSAERGLTARRLYDEHGGLLAGDWRRSDGVQTIYQHGAPPQLHLAPEKRGNTEAPGFADVWQLSPSAKDFNALIGHSDRASVEVRPASYVISYANTEDDGNAQGLVKATLVLSSADLHAIEQTLVIRQGSEVREFRFMEASFERHAPSTVAPAVFEPDRELLVLSGKSEGAKAIGAAQPVSPSSILSPPRAMATAALEVEVLRLVNVTGADLGEQVSVSRTPEGTLSVKGVVDTEQRKREILQALSPVINNPAVKVEVNTTAEALRQKQPAQASTGSVIVERVEAATSSIPAAAELRRHFSGRGLSNEQVEQEVSRFSNRMLDLSRQAEWHAWAIKRLAERFSPEERRALDASARAKWLTLIRDHARAIQQEAAALRQELGVVFPFLPSGDAQGIVIGSDEDLMRAAARLVELASANNRAIQSAFTLSTGDAASLEVKTPQFWRSMRAAEDLAAKMQSAAR